VIVADNDVKKTAHFGKKKAKRFVKLSVAQA
jgi:hypothetical protein